MKLIVELATNDKTLGFHLFNSQELNSGQTTVNLGKGVSATFKGTMFRKSVGIPDVIQLVLEIGKDVVIGIGVGLISAWLYDKLNGRDVKKLTIEKTEVTINKGQIEKIIIEKIQEEK